VNRHCIDNRFTDDASQQIEQRSGRQAKGCGRDLCSWVSGPLRVYDSMRSRHTDLDQLDNRQKKDSHDQPY
jgi:hypothetical protein